MTTTEYRLHGPPGCGKTYALANTWVPRAVDRFGEDRVMVASLTKTAAVEIASRLPIPRDRVGTLHAHAFRALGSPEIATQPRHVEEWNRVNPQWRLQPETREAREEGGAGGPAAGNELLAELGVLRHRLAPHDRWPIPVRQFAAAWARWKEDEDLVDFDDMIERAHDEIEAAPGLPEVLIVDEAQDCSRLELQLVRKWAAHADHLVLAGDGDQAIFDWRGADAQAFLGGDLPEEQNYKLTQSYRVPRQVHALARAWIARASARYAVEYLPRDAEGRVARSPTRGCYGRGMLHAIERSLGSCEDDESVMIVASCGYMLNATIKHLRDAGIGFCNPYRPTHGGWNPCGDRGGVGRLAAFLTPCPHFTDTPHLWTIRELDRWVELVDAKVLPRGAKKTIKEDVKAQRRRHDLSPLTPERLAELIGDGLFQRLGRMFMDARDTPLAPITWLRSNLNPSKHKSMQYAFTMAREHGLRAIAARPRVIVGTIHSVKGGEASHVHLLPDISNQAYRGWQQVGPSKDAIIRQFYVAATRAKQSLTIHAGSGGYAVNI